LLQEKFEDTTGAARQHTIKWTKKNNKNMIYITLHRKLRIELGDFQKNEDFSFSENNLNIK
jgi:hypothetical protein